MARKPEDRPRSYSALRTQHSVLNWCRNGSGAIRRSHSMAESQNFDLQRLPGASSGSFAIDRRLSSQIRGAPVSPMSNIAEGFERNRLTEFHQFLSVAKGSCAEVRSHLYVALDAGYFSQKQFDELFVQAQEVGRLVGGLRASLKNQSKMSTAPNSLSQHSGLSTQDV